MTRRILRYTVPVKYPVTYNLGATTEILHVGVKEGVDVVQFWAIDDSREIVREPRTFFVAGTGHIIPDGSIYRGTAIALPFVWHLMEEGELS